MKQLEIDGVDFLDPRMIGVKCWFSVSHNEDAGIISTLTRVGANAVGEPLFYDSHGATWFNCRITQGKKTTYAGDKRPFADGVRVKVWLVNAPTIIDYAECIKWEYVTHYQIQEMPEQEEVHKRVFEYDGAYHCLDCDAKWGVLTDRLEEPAKCIPKQEDDGSAIDMPETTTITNELRDRVVTCLHASRRNCNDLFALDVTERRVWVEQTTIINDLLKELGKKVMSDLTGKELGGCDGG